MKGIRTRTVELALPCNLTDEEVVEKALEQAHHHTEKKGITEKVLDLRADLKAVQIKIDALGDTLATKTVDRLVRCEVVSFVEQMKEVTVRLDLDRPQVVRVVSLPESEAVYLDLAPGDEPSYEVAQVIKDHIELTLEQRVDLALDRHRDGELTEGNDVPALEVSNLLLEVDPDRNWPDVATIEGWTTRERWHVGVWVRQMDAAEEYIPVVLNLWFQRLHESLSPCAMVKLYINATGNGGVGDDELARLFERGVPGTNQTVERIAWALVHVGEVSLVREPQEGEDPKLLYSAAVSQLAVDVDSMLEAQPELGTEDGLPEGGIVMIRFKKADDVDPATRLAEKILAFVNEKGGEKTRRDILTRFSGENPVAVGEAVDSLVEPGGPLENAGYDSVRAPSTDGLVDLTVLGEKSLRAIDAMVNAGLERPHEVGNDELRERIRKASPRLSLEHLSVIELHPLYLDATGQESGGLRAKKMRAGILEAWAAEATVAALRPEPSGEAAE